MSDSAIRLKDGEQLIDALKTIDAKPDSVIFVDAASIDLDRIMDCEFPEQYAGITFIPVRVKLGHTLRDAILQMNREELTNLLEIPTK